MRSSMETKDVWASWNWHTSSGGGRGPEKVQLRSQELPYSGSPCVPSVAEAMKWAYDLKYPALSEG